MAPRVLVPACVATVLLLVAAGAAAGPDPQVLADGAACFEALDEAQDATCSVLYAHIADLLRWKPLSVQPLPEDAPDLATGGFPGASGQDLLYPGLGAVRWDEQGGAHTGGRGPADAVRLVPGMPIHAYWYLSVDSLEFSGLGMGAGSGSIGVMPCVTVEMQVQATRTPSEPGPIIAHGKTTKTVVSLDGMPDTPLPLTEPCPDSTGTVVAGDVHEFHVVMERVPESRDVLEHLVVNVLWYQFDPSGDPQEPDKLIQPQWNLRSGPELRPRVVFPLESAVRVMETAILERDGLVGFSARFKSPWGSYEFVSDVIHRHDFTGNNVNTERLAVHITGPDGERIQPTALGGPHLRYYIGHGIDDERLNVTYVWRPGSDPDLAPGTYTIIIEADNLQGTATARAEFLYVLAGETEVAPVAPVLLALLAVLAALILRRRVSTKEP